MAGRHRLRKQRHPGLWVLVALPIVVVAAMAYPALSAPQEVPSPSVAASVDTWQARASTTPPLSTETLTGPLTAACSDYGGTMPHVAHAGRILDERYPAVRITAAPGGLDVWTSDVDLGWRVARYVLNNLDELHALYVIYRSSVALDDADWHTMRDRGDDTANHDDHLHVSFRSAPPAGADCPEEE